MLYKIDYVEHCGFEEKKSNLLYNIAYILKKTYTSTFFKSRKQFNMENKSNVQYKFHDIDYIFNILNMN